MIGCMSGGMESPNSLTENVCGYCEERMAVL